MASCAHCGGDLPADAQFCPYDGRPADGGPRDPLLGTVVAGRYLVTAQIGAGGMAAVYMARHQTLQRDVALKVMHPQIAAQSKHVERFAREARAAARIDHENVVFVLDFGYSEDIFYIAMEHVAGKSLAAELEAGRFTAERSTHVLAQIAAGVGRAHELGIVHRDLKPENIILTARGMDTSCVKLLDFGLSKVVAGTPEKALTAAGEIFGTPHFMAPEQWRGQEIDARTDIYAMGGIAYEMLSGRPPFEGGIGALLTAHLEDPPPPIGPDLAPPELRALVVKCLQKDPADRFQSTGELLAAIGRVWKAVPSKSRRSTYADTAAAPPPPTSDSHSDPTMFAGEVDPVWDGPELAAEIRRLHGLRNKRLAELSAALWGDDTPTEVRELRAAIEQVEAYIDRGGEEIALLRAEREELVNAAREHEAELRAEIIDASLVLSAEHEELPADLSDFFANIEDEPTAPVSVSVAMAELDRPGTPSSGDPAARLRHAERRLASSMRKRTRQELDVQEALERMLARVWELELELAPLNEELSRIVERHAKKRRDLRPLRVAFGKVDGAIVSYQALLTALEERGPNPSDFEDTTHRDPPGLEEFRARMKRDREG